MVDNKALLLQCAKELFYAKGYDAVGVQEIVDRAGLTKPTLYYYFGSKIGLLKTLVETEFADLRLQIQESVYQGQDIRSKLHQMARAYCQFFEKDQAFFFLMMALFYSAPENETYQVVRPFVVETYEMIVRVFEEESDQLGNMNGRQREFAIGFIGTIHHYLLLYRAADLERSREQMETQVTALVNQFMYGIFT